MQLNFVFEKEEDLSDMVPAFMTPEIGVNFTKL